MSFELGYGDIAFFLSKSYRLITTKLCPSRPILEIWVALIFLELIRDTRIDFLRLFTSRLSRFFIYL